MGNKSWICLIWGQSDPLWVQIRLLCFGITIELHLTTKYLFYQVSGLNITSPVISQAPSISTTLSTGSSVQKPAAGKHCWLLPMTVLVCLPQFVSIFCTAKLECHQTLVSNCLELLAGAYQFMNRSWENCTLNYYFK